MRRVVSVALVLAFALALTSALPALAATEAATDAKATEVNAPDVSPLELYYQAIAEYFQVPRTEVQALVGRVLDLEIPIVFFLAREGHTDVATVMRWKDKKTPWAEISTRYSVTAEAYYVPLRYVGPPFGRAYGHYKKLPRERWREIVLNEEDILNLVNLRILAERYGVRADTIVSRRGEGQNYIQINAALRQAALKAPSPTSGKKSR